MRAISRPVQTLSGQIIAPGDKSCSHRALMLAAIASGNSEVSGLLASEDVLATAKAMQALGAKLEQTSQQDWQITGCTHFTSPAKPLNMGNSGTGARLLMGLVAGYQTDCTFIGDASLSSRPMGRILDPLGEMGAQYESIDGRLPVRIIGNSPLSGIDYTLPLASAQVKSALLLAGLKAQGTTKITEPRRTRAHTETMLPLFGIELEQQIVETRATIALQGGQTPQAAKIQIPGDPSSAAFLWGAALIACKSQLRIQMVMTAAERDGLRHVAHAMGANLTLEASDDLACGETCAHIQASATPLQATNPAPEHVASMIDEYPLFAVLAAFAHGDSHVHGAKELRHKESDRIRAIVRMLRVNGVEIDEHEDGFSVRGCAGPPPGGGLVESHGDHRIAMSALIMGTAAQNPIQVDDVSAIATSYPQFFAHMRQIGADMEILDQ